MENLKYWIWFSRIDELSPIKKIKIVKKFKNLKQLYLMTEEELIKNNVSKKDAEKILNLEYRKHLEKYIEYIQKNDIKVINYYNKKYPQKLKEIYDPPIVLYLKGNDNILNEYGFAIVGCRDCTKYGEYVAKKIAYDLGKNNINVISGLAKGIDSYSHIGAIKANATTIAVVGCGLDTVYPKENKYLFDKIIKGNGAIISEYVIGTKPIAKNFPARNRIISGISNGVIVVEAKEKSGTLITVDFALDQGKDVYVVPGNITSINSCGTNELIKQGAKIITNLNDILK